MVALLTLALAAQSAPWDPGVELYWEEVAPGVEHTAYVTDAPLAVNVLRIDLTEPGLEFEAVPGIDNLHQRTRTSLIAKALTQPGYEVVAGVNASFGHAGNAPVGFFVREGEMLVSPTLATALAISQDNQAVISRFERNLTLQPAEGGLTIEPDHLNRWYEYETGALYSEHWLRAEVSRPNVIDVVFDLDGQKLSPNGEWALTVEKVRPTRGGTPVPEGGLVLQVLENQVYANAFKVGEEWVLTSNTVPDLSPWDTVVSAGPGILSDGDVNVNIEAEGIREGFDTERHPRTAMGVDAAGETLWLVTVDGRQEGWSRGIDLYELAELLRYLGADDAANLDGGGSTTMWVDGQVVNRPSDPTGERHVASSLLVIRTE
ncbi:MAG: phosphodiester glycosidase family protein [Fimbriimonadaceae bacterium]